MAVPLCAAGDDQAFADPVDHFGLAFPNILFCAFPVSYIDIFAILDRKGFRKSIIFVLGGVDRSEYDQVRSFHVGVLRTGKHRTRQQTEHKYCCKNSFHS